MASKHTDYNDIWEDLVVEEKDLDFINNRLFELETPLNTAELVEIFIEKRIEDEREQLKELNASKAKPYLPKEDFEIGQKIALPAFGWEECKVVDKREGNNPETRDFSVIEVEFKDGSKKMFAANLEDHKLNQTVIVALEEELLDKDTVLSKYRKSISLKLTKALEKNDDLVQIAGFWFPSSLLVDVNAGYLNLSEAVLEVAEGGPLPTEKILEQIELPTDANQTLTEFSLNYALQEDSRFDEVGPSGETLWYLHRLEPEQVKHQPKYLQSNTDINFDKSQYQDFLDQINADVFDELEEGSLQDECISDVTVSIIYPHWKSGTLPLSACLENLFPTAYEAPRINFTFVDGNSRNKFDGWVVRENRYVYGLRDWYRENEVMPGSLIHIRQGKNPGEVVVSIDKKRSSREWIRTATVGEDDRISFAMDKQQVSTNFDERMIIAIPDEESVGYLWDKYENYPYEKLIPVLIRELAKLNPQGHVHAQELYSAMNVIKRCSPSYILYLLDHNDNVDHLGDLYYRLKI